MLKIVKVFLIMSVSIFGLGFSDSKVDEFIYGPYLNDHDVQLNETLDIYQVMKQRKCNKNDVLKLDSQFILPGLFTKLVTEEQSLNLIQCAWEKSYLSTKLMDFMIYSDQLNQRHTTDNMTIREIIYDPSFILHIASFYQKYFGRYQILIQIILKYLWQY